MILSIVHEEMLMLAMQIDALLQRCYHYSCSTKMFSNSHTPKLTILRVHTITFLCLCEVPGLLDY
jgi:hypothetical protein